MDTRMPQFFIPLLLLVFTYFVIVFTIDTCYPQRQQMRMGMYDNGCRMCDGNGFEEFTNEMSSYTQSQTLLRQRSDLTPPNTSDNSPSHLMVGSATKNIVKSNEKTEALIEISGNMYILNGNVYTNKDQVKQQAYSAFLVDENGERLYLGDLKRGQDGEHHLRVKTSNLEQLAGFDRIMVTYKSNGDEYVILNGKF